MVRNAQLAEYERTPRPVVAIANDFPAGHVMPPHRHARSQLVYGVSGVMLVGSEQGRWVVPPERAAWIPAGVVHDLRMLSRVSTVTIWVDPDGDLDLPQDCQVVAVSPLMRSLLLESVDIAPEYDGGTREALVMSLLLHELIRLPTLPLCLPFPRHEGLARRCRAFLSVPQPHDTIDAWSAALNMSRRTFTRLFRKETGLTFSAWRQQACLFAAMPRLAADDAVTTVALDLGYDSPAAFTTMFKRLLGVPPSRYFSTRDGGAGEAPPRRRRSSRVAARSASPA
jgi:AraC-like DNA-binding protein